MSWPNLFTFFRFLLTPVFIILILNNYFSLASIIFLMAGITDAIDGFLARYLNQATKLGACLDPIADKLLLCSGFVLLAWYQYIPSWLAVIVLCRDAFILLGGLLFFLFNIEFEIKPSLLGKATTLVQIITVLAVLINIQVSLPPLLLSILLGITLILTVASGFQYAYMGYEILK